GKSSLAVRIGHAATDAFPDGQWFVRTRGRSTGDVLAELLGFCGVRPGAVPSRTAEQAELLRERLTGRKVLLILDDAVSVHSVRPLLPNSAGTAVVVTSRQSLGELAVIAGARGTTLEPLSAKESRTLLSGVLGANDALEELVDLCAGLPLALRT